jgi:RAD51-like protein 2
MHITNFIQVVSQGLVKLNWGMLCLLLNASAIDLLTKYKLFFRIQLAINVQIPVEYGGLGGKAVYIGK